MNFEYFATLAPDQMVQHLPVAFTVPEGVGRLILDFDYAPHKTDGWNNLVTLTVVAPDGVRGEGHRGQPTQRVELSAAAATPGYVPGPVTAGEWQVILNTHQILEPLSVRLIATFEADAPALSAPPAPAATAPRGPGWYRGDLHGHSLHSDGRWSVAEFAAFARAERLDFVTLTDHNTISGHAELHALAGDDLLTLVGSEITTYHGHAVAFGMAERVDWRVGGERSMTDVLDAVEAAGALFVIAHPHTIGNPACTGCDWQYAELMPGKARYVEIWNGPWGSTGDKNVRGLAQWYAWLNEGYRMRATAGSDIHGQPDAPPQYGRNVVYAEALTPPAILAGLRAGHHFISAGPHLELTAAGADGTSAMMGELLPAGAATAEVRWEDVPENSTLRWIVDGAVQQEAPTAGASSAALDLDGARWVVAELRRDDGALLAVTNPVFFGDDWR